MNRISTNKPVVFAFFGFPGSGKSFVARQLAENIEAIWLSSGKIRDELFEKPTYDKRENAVVNNILNYMVTEFLKANCSIVLDADISSKIDRRNWRNLAQKFHADFLLTWIQIDSDAGFKRVSSRDKRRVDDKNSQVYNRQLFEQVSAKLQNPSSDENYVVVSGKHNFNTQLATILRRLRELRLVDLNEADGKMTKPGLVNLIPNPTAGRTDMSRRDIIIR